MSSPFSPTPAALPPELMGAAARTDEQIVIVMGAGCSREAPTGLELADELSERVHQTLVANGSLPADAVNDPSDLSELAQAIFDVTRSQRLLVDEFPPAVFRTAEPNEGHLTLAALLRERVIGDVLTLNFDLAISSALSVVGASRDVSVIKGPEEHNRQGARNVIYLHRNIESPPDDLILRPEQMDEAWKEQWEEVIARRVLSGPMTVFVGLGSPAAVLTATTRWIMRSLETQTVYVVDPGEPQSSGFFGALDVPEDRYVRLGWCEFMYALGARVLAEHDARLVAACRKLIRDDPSRADEDVTDVCARLASLGLRRLGRVRARWFLDAGEYMPHPADARVLNLLADLVIGMAMLERLIERKARFDEDGLAVFDGPAGQSALLIASGQGVMSWERVTAEIARQLRELARRGRAVAGAVAAGIVGSREDVVAPENIAGIVDQESVATGAVTEIVSMEELRGDSRLAARLVA